MLNKKICKKCVKESLQGEGKWSKNDDFLWYKDKIVYCSCGFPPHASAIALSIYKNPPDWCPYILEHVMMIEPSHAK